MHYLLRYTPTEYEDEESGWFMIREGLKDKSKKNLGLIHTEWLNQEKSTQNKTAQEHTDGHSTPKNKTSQQKKKKNITPEKKSSEKNKKKHIDDQEDIAKIKTSSKEGQVDKLNPDMTSKQTETIRSEEEKTCETSSSNNAIVEENSNEKETLQDTDDQHTKRSQRDENIINMEDKENEQSEKRNLQEEPGNDREGMASDKHEKDMVSKNGDNKAEKDLDIVQDKSESVDLPNDEGNKSNEGSELNIDEDDEKNNLSTDKNEKSDREEGESNDLSEDDDQSKSAKSNKIEDEGNNVLNHNSNDKQEDKEAEKDKLVNEENNGSNQDLISEEDKQEDEEAERDKLVNKEENGSNQDLIDEEEDEVAESNEVIVSKDHSGDKNADDEETEDEESSAAGSDDEGSDNKEIVGNHSTKKGSNQDLIEEEDEVVESNKAIESKFQSEDKNTEKEPSAAGRDDEDSNDKELAEDHSTANLETVTAEDNVETNDKEIVAHDEGNVGTANIGTATPVDDGISPSKTNNTTGQPVNEIDTKNKERAGHDGNNIETATPVNDGQSHPIIESSTQTFTRDIWGTLDTFFNLYIKLNAEKREKNHTSFVVPLSKMLDPKVDRPELVLLGERQELKWTLDDGTVPYNFYVQYVPFTRKYEDFNNIKQVMTHQFVESNEFRIIDKVANDHETQAFNLSVRTLNENQCDEMVVVSSIMFRIVCEPDDQFLFVYYRATNDKPLCDHAKNRDDCYKNYKLKSDNLGIGYFLLSLAQQYFCNHDENRQVFKIYLMAIAGKISDFYVKKLGFEEVGFVDEDDSNNLLKNASTELKKCLELEECVGSNLKLLQRETILPQDTVDFNRKLKNITAHKINHIDLKAFKNEVSYISKVMQKDYSSNWRKITNDQVNDYGEQYKEIYKHDYYEEIGKTNPYEFLLPEIQKYSKFYFKLILDDLENNTREQKRHMEQSLDEIVDIVDSVYEDDDINFKAAMEVDSDSDSDEEEFEKDAYMKFNNIDKQMLRMFALEVNFDGNVQDKTVLKCQSGNIYCTECKKRILQKDQSLEILEKYGAMIMQQHLTGNNQYMGFASYKKKSELKESKDLDRSMIMKCTAISNRKLCTQLHKAMELDAMKTSVQKTKGWNHAIVLVQCVLNNFYGKKKEMHQEYIKRGARRISRALEFIKNDCSKKHLKVKKTVPKDLKKLLQLYHDIYFDRKSYGPSFAERENETLLAITTNPKKKPKRVMYHGHDVTDYAPGPERKKQKHYLDEKEFKLNWKTVELVNKNKRDPKNPLSEQSKRCERPVHWLGTSTMYGKDKQHLISFDLIPEKFRKDPGEVFTKEFFSNVQYNVPVDVDKKIIDRFKDHYDILENTVLSRIRLKIDKKTKEKKWEAVTLDNHFVGHLVDENWLRKNFEKQYPHYFIKYMTQKNIWHQLPVGAKRDIQNLPKKETDEVVSVYSPNEFKCAFANLANGLNSIHDYETAEFFENHLDSNYETLTSLLNDDGTKSAKSQFQLAIRLLQFRFGYTCMKLGKKDTLLKPPLPGTIKYATLVAGHDDHNHVISIVENKIFESSNKKVLTLCKENIAWCSTKTIESLDKSGRTIQSGYLLTPPKRIKKKIRKRSIHEIETDDHKNMYERRSKKTKVGKK